MHIEVLVEDASGSRLLEHLLPKLIGPSGEPHSWRIHPYKGIGRIPKGLRPRGGAEKRILLDQLPRVLRGYGKTHGVDAVLVVVDVDAQDCIAFLHELQGVAASCAPGLRVLFRLAIEEVEAWYFGDRHALLTAYPRGRRFPLDTYEQDSICGTWETLADAIHDGGAETLRRAGWPLVGEVKHEWADKIGPLMEIERNTSPSFRKLRDGLRRLTGERIPSSASD